MAGPEDSQRQDDRGLSSLARAYQKAGPMMGAGVSLAGSVAGFTLLGHLVDGWVGTEKPWFLIAGAVFGMIGGFISFFRLALGLDKAGKAAPSDEDRRP